MNTLAKILITLIMTLIIYLFVKGLVIYVFVFNLNYLLDDIHNSSTINGYLNTSIFIAFITSFIIYSKFLNKLKLVNNSNIVFFYTTKKYIIFNELTRPWKLISLTGGVLALIFGSYVTKLPDWDINISIIMGILTYILGPWSLYKLLYSYLYKKSIIFYSIVFLFCYLLTVDFSYVIYNEYKNNMYFRLYNFACSSVLYFLYSFVLLFQGTLTEFKNEIKKIFLVKNKI